MMFPLSQAQLIVIALMLLVLVGIPLLGSGRARGAKPVPTPAPVPTNNTLQLRGFGYASCDGNYVWSGKRDHDGNLLFLADQQNLAPGQDPDRSVSVAPDGTTACGSRQEIDVYGRRAPGAISITYDHTLWNK